MKLSFKKGNAVKKSKFLGIFFEFIGERLKKARSLTPKCSNSIAQIVTLMSKIKANTVKDAIVASRISTTIANGSTIASEEEITNFFSQ